MGELRVLVKSISDSGPPLAATSSYLKSEPGFAEGKTWRKYGLFNREVLSICFNCAFASVLHHKADKDVL